MLRINDLSIKLEKLENLQQIRLLKKGRKEIINTEAEINEVKAIIQ